MPCQNLGFDIKAQNWKVQPQQKNIDRIFNGEDIITLNRYDPLSFRPSRRQA